MSKLKLMSLAAAALAISVIGAEAAPVVPATGQQVAAAAGQSNVTQVQYWGGGRRIYGGRGYGGGGRYYGRWRGPLIGGGALIAGAIIANEIYRPRRGYYYDTYAYDGPYYYPEGYTGDPRKICAQNFRSFEWSTGMYTTYGGERKLCPYLRG